MASDPDRLARVVAQHAETLRLLGVDHVPVRRGRAAKAPVAAPVEPAALPATVAHADPRRAAAQARLDAIRARYERDAPHRNFVTEFQNIVFGEGDPCARLMFIGEAPGADEDATGRPFVGKAGQFLDRMIAAMGLARSAVYICNVLKTRPIDNATPTVEEAQACAPYLYEQIAAVGPEVIVTLGLPASRLILGSTASMGQLRGTWAAYSPPAGVGPASPVPVMPTYHPAYLLRAYTTENRQKVWDDLKKVMERLGLSPSAGRGGPA